MHLGLIIKPFVRHNLMLAQESPVPVPRFQMAPRLKILMSSGSKKGTQIYYPFLSKVPASESPPGSPMGPCGERCPYPEPFLTYLPGSPVKEHSPEAVCTEPLQRETLHSWSPLQPSLKAPSRRAPFEVPQRGPYGNRCPSPKPFLPILQGTQRGNPLSRFPSQGSHSERHPNSIAPFIISQSPW